MDPRVTLAALAHPWLHSAAAPRLVERISQLAGLETGLTDLTFYCLLLTAHCSLLTFLGRVIAIARAHARIFHATQLDFDLAKAPVTSFVRRVITEAVLRADLVSDLREGSTRIL